MESRPLGSAGPLVPAITFGAWPIGGGMGAVDEATAVATIHRALDRGITAIDTAEAYRVSEAIVGRALAGRARDRVFLATKVSTGPYTRERLQDALTNSLRALQTDYVDLYQLHSFPNGVALDDALDALDEVRESGKARFVGVSNFTVEQLARCAGRKIQSLQPRLNIFDAEHARDVLPYCAANGIGVIVHSPLAKGLLTGKYRPGHVFPPDDERGQFPRFQVETFTRYVAQVDQLATLARAKGATLTELAIAWTLAQPGVSSCIVGAKTPDQVDEHVGAVALRLMPDEMTEIERIVGR